MENEVMANEFIVKRGLKVSGDVEVLGSVNGRNPVTDGSKLDHISVSQAVNLDTIEADIAINNAKVGISTAQANAITANTAKVGITTSQANAIVANTSKVGVTSSQANAIIANTAKISNINHPLVETAVPIGAVFTDTIASSTEVSSTAPTAPVSGDLWFDTTNEVLYQYQVDSWVQISDDGVVASADFQATEIKTAYESNTNTNAFLDTEKTKLTGIEVNATAQPSIVDNGDATAITIDSSENVSIDTGNGSKKGLAIGETYSQYDGWNTQLNVHGTSHSRITAKTANIRMGMYAHDSWTAGTAGYLGTYTNHPLAFQINASQKMLLDTSGRLTIPNQPSFDAHSPAKIGSGTVIWGGTRSNTGNHFSTTTGLFTAPIAGVYHFSFNLMMGNPMTASYVRPLFALNGIANTRYGDTLDSNTGGSYKSSELSITTKLAANDTWSVINNANTESYGASYGAFSGFLVG